MKHKRPSYPEIVALVVLAIFGASFILCLGLVSSGAPRPPGGSYFERRFAWEMSQKFVKKRLKAPDTAKFPRDPIASKFVNGKWHIVGEVTAQNPFGVPLRHRYAATLWEEEKKHLFSSHWKCLPIIFDSDLELPP